MLNFCFSKSQTKSGVFPSALTKCLQKHQLLLQLLIGQQVSHPSIESLMHLQSLREPLELFEACADLNASGISWSYEHAVHIIKLLSNGEGFFFLFFFFSSSFYKLSLKQGKTFTCTVQDCNKTRTNAFT